MLLWLNGHPFSTTLSIAMFMTASFSQLVSMDHWKEEKIARDGCSHVSNVVSSAYPLVSVWTLSVFITKQAASWCSGMPLLTQP